MSELRWILLIIGLIVLGAMYWWGRKPNQSKGRRSRRRANRRMRRDKEQLLLDEPQEPSLPADKDDKFDFDPVLADPEPPKSQAQIDFEQDELGLPKQPVVAEEVPMSVAEELAAELEEVTSTPPSPSSSGTVAASETESAEVPVLRNIAGLADENSNRDKLVMLYLVADKDKTYQGPDLVEAMEETGLAYGARKLFDRVAHTGETQSNGVVVYSIANIVEPGFFELEGIEHFSTPGLTIFMLLPGPLDGITAYEDLIATAWQLMQKLGGSLLDGDRQPLTDAHLEQLRSEIIEHRIWLREQDNS